MHTSTQAAIVSLDAADLLFKFNKHSKLTCTDRLFLKGAVHSFQKVGLLAQWNSPFLKTTWDIKNKVSRSRMSHFS